LLLVVESGIMLLMSNSWERSLRDDQVQATLAVLKIRQDYDQNKIVSILNMKSALFATERGLSQAKLLADAVNALTSGCLYRGPSHRHGFDLAAADRVYEFIVQLYQGEIYVKFFVTEHGTEFRSFHPTERSIDKSFRRL